MSRGNAKNMSEFTYTPFPDDHGPERLFRSDGMVVSPPRHPFDFAGLHIPSPVGVGIFSTELGDETDATDHDSDGTDCRRSDAGS